MLNQPPAFRPFMQQFTPLALIAMWTSNYDITRPIRSALRNWYDMIDMIFIAKFYMAIIALTPLAFVLSLNILRCIATFCAASLCQPRSNIVRMSFVPTSHIFVPFISSAIAPASMSGAFFVLVGVVIIAHALSIVFKIVIPPSAIPGEPLIAIGSFVLATVLKFMLFIFWAALSAIFHMTSFASTAKFSITTDYKKVCEIREQVSIALRAAFEGIGDIKHSDLLSSHLGFEVGAEPRNSACRTVNYAVLAHSNYTTEGGYYAV